MALYTGKGDDGSTSTFGCDQRMSKSSAIAEALGVMDEANSFIGLCKVRAEEEGVMLGTRSVASLLHELQDNCFTVQAELAGAPHTIVEEKVRELERIITEIEPQLPPIKSFLIPGGNELSARLDVARTLIRRAERRVVAVHEEGIQKVGVHTLAFLNRASSVLYALVRFVNHERGVSEKAPDYR